MYPAEDLRSPWWLAVAGVVSIIFGIAAIFWPELTLRLLIYLFGFYVILFGLAELGQTFTPAAGSVPWWMHLGVGILSILAGLAALFWPAETGVVLLYIIASWAVIVGLIEIAAAFLLNQWFIGIGGAISIVFGLLLFANPMAGALAFIVVIGVFAIIRGILLLVAAIAMPRAPEVGA